MDVPALAPKGVRRITVDRPGVGFSDPQPGRVLLDWPDDVRVLADTLGLQSFAGAGHVRRWALRRGIRLCPGRADYPRRARQCFGATRSTGALKGMNRGEAATMMLARRAPLLAQCVVGAAVTTERFRSGTVYRGLLKALPEADRRLAARPRVRDSLVDSYTLAFREGVRGQVHDWAIIASPWGFRPEDIGVPVQLYHGRLDDRVPLHHARDLAARIQHCQLIDYPDEGHMVVFSHAEEILNAVVAPAA